jgi:hypothetical protein
MSFLKRLMRSVIDGDAVWRFGHFICAKVPTTAAALGCQLGAFLSIPICSSVVVSAIAGVLALAVIGTIVPLHRLI